MVGKDKKRSEVTGFKGVGGTTKTRRARFFTMLHHVPCAKWSKIAQQQSECNTEPTCVLEPSSP